MNQLINYGRYSTMMPLMQKIRMYIKREHVLSDLSFYERFLLVSHIVLPKIF